MTTSTHSPVYKQGSLMKLSSNNIVPQSERVLS